MIIAGCTGDGNIIWNPIARRGVKRAYAAMDTWRPDGIVALNSIRAGGAAGARQQACGGEHQRRSPVEPFQTVISDHMAMGKMAARHLFG